MSKMKTFKPFLFVFVLLITSLFFTSAALAPSSEYEISPDTSLYSLALNNHWAFRNGELWRSAFGDAQSSGQLYSGYVDTFLNEFNLATLQDVQDASLTVPDLVSGLTQYFGSYPFTYSRRYLFSSNPIDSTVVNSFTDFLSYLGRDLSFDLVTPTGVYILGPGGLPLNIDSAPIWFINSSGFLGLSQNLVGNGSQTFIDTLGNTSFVSNVLSGISKLNTNLLSDLQIFGPYHMLLRTGEIDTVNDASISNITAEGFMGLWQIIHGPNNTEGRLEFLDYTDLSSEQVENTNLSSLLSIGLSRIQNDFARYLYSHGTDMDIEIRENMQQQADTFVDDFTSSSGGGTPSVSDVSDTAGVSKGLGSVFSTGSSASDVFNTLSSSGNYGFFSTEVQNELNPFYSSRSYSRIDDGYLDYVTPHIDSILGGLGSSW